MVEGLEKGIFQIKKKCLINFFGSKQLRLKYMMAHARSYLRPLVGMKCAHYKCYNFVLGCRKGVSYAVLIFVMKVE